jgi:hypothetical protein
MAVAASRQLTTQQTVYLDWSNIVHLTNARLKDRAVYASALTEWRAHSRALAFTRAHVVEWRQHRDAEVRATGVRTLQDLLPIRTDVEASGTFRTRPLPMTDREILVAIAQKNVLPDLAWDAGSRFLPDTSAFPRWWRDDGMVNTVRSYDSPVFDGFVKDVRGGVEHLMDKLTRPPGTPYKRMKLRDLSVEPPVSTVEKLAETSADYMERFGQVKAALASMAPGGQRDLLTNAIDGLRLFGERVATNGLRQTWADLMDLAGDPSAEGRYLDDIAWEWVFRRTAAILLVDVTGIDAVRAIDLAKRIPIASCPGSWLSREVELEIRKRESNPDASSAYDLDHLVYFPYVDSFYADKRIAAYAKLVLARAGGPTELSGRAPPRFVGRSVANLAKSLNLS